MHCAAASHMESRAGHTYEREAIEQWLVTHSTSPLTNEELRHKTLTPNYMVRGLIQRFGTRSRAGTVAAVH